MKRFFSILSSIVFLFGAAGYYFAFTAADNHARNEMIEAIQSSFHTQNSIQLSFSKIELQKEVRFTKANHNEFIYRGQHYDVVKSQQEGERIRFTCMADKKETSLFTAFDKQLSEQSSGNNTSGKTSVKPLTPDWFFQLSTSGALSESTVFVSSSPDFFLSQVLLEISSPPPKA